MIRAEWTRGGKIQAGPTLGRVVREGLQLRPKIRKARHVKSKGKGILGKNLMCKSLRVEKTVA